MVGCSFGAVLVQCWCSFGAVLLQFWCSSGAVLVQFLRSRGAVLVQSGTQVNKYACTNTKNTIITNHTTDSKSWKFVNENANHQAHPSSKASMTHQVWNNTYQKAHHRKVTKALAQYN